MTREKAQAAVAVRWNKATKADRARQGTWLNDLPPDVLSARNRANAKKRWAKKRKADKLLAKSAKIRTNSRKSEHFT
jgi:hypothetical protein